VPILPSARSRTAAVLGLAGAVLSGIGDVIMLGRPCSGRDFDDATGRIPPNVDVDPRWRSLWNGASFTPGRRRVGTVIGVVGIGALQGVGLTSTARSLPPGGLRRLATVAAVGFAVSGVLTHLGCGAVILAYRRTAEGVADVSDRRQPAPRSVTTVLAVSAVGALGALAVFSGAVVGAAGRGPNTTPTVRAVRAIATPFPWVVATLLTFGALPAPIGGYARPASMSIGLAASFAAAVAAAEELSSTGANPSRRTRRR
jgi:hypothetical protein